MPDTSKKPSAACAACDTPAGAKICFSENGQGSPGCPTLFEKALLEETREIYKDPEVFEFAKNASIQEG